MMQKVQTKVKSRSKMVIIPHLPTNLQPHVNWYSPHKTCFFSQSYCVLYRNFIINNRWHTRRSLAFSDENKSKKCTIC